MEWTTQSLFSYFFLYLTVYLPSKKLSTCLLYVDIDSSQVFSCIFVRFFKTMHVQCYLLSHKDEDLCLPRKIVI